MSSELSRAERRANEMAAILSGYWAKADQVWLNALLQVADEAPDADKEVIWLTCEEIAAIRGWRWSHGDGQWKRRKDSPQGATAASDDAQHEKEAKTPHLPT